MKSLSATQRLTAQVIPLPGAQTMPVKQMRRGGRFPIPLTHIREAREKRIAERESMRKKWDSLHVEYGFYKATLGSTVKRLEDITGQIEAVRTQINEIGGC